MELALWNCPFFYRSYQKQHRGSDEFVLTLNTINGLFIEYKTYL